MLLSVLIVLTLSISIYWIAPKVHIDPQSLPVQENVLQLPKNIQIFSWNNAKRKFLNEIIGPESFTHNPQTGEIYTGTLDGMIWRINKELTKAEPLMRIGEDHEDCGKEHVAHICGRVLGLKFLSPNKLIVVDAYNGIIMIDLNNLKKQFLVRPDQDNLTKSLKMFNSVDISKNGIIYFTVLSTKWEFHDVMYSILEGENTGRVYSYNLKTKELDIIASNIYAANGLIFINNETNLVLSEYHKRRLIKINLLNLNEKPSVFIDNLPGFPDNIKRIDNENSYVAVTRASSFLNPYPSFRYFLAWFIPKYFLASLYSPTCEIYKFNDQGEIKSIINGTGLGNIIITEAYEVGGRILFGNLHQPYFHVIDSK